MFENSRVSSSATAGLAPPRVRDAAFDARGASIREAGTHSLLGELTSLMTRGNGRRTGGARYFADDAGAAAVAGVAGVAGGGVGAALGIGDTVGPFALPATPGDAPIASSLRSTPSDAVSSTE